MPKLADKLCDAVNEQIRSEIESAYLYLDMSCKCAAKNLKGAQHWLRRQWEEEMGHATKLIDYVIERGNEVELQEVEKPEFKFHTLTQVFEHALKHEESVTRSIHELYDSAVKERDYAAQALLQWFMSEQVEEENSAREIVETLRIAGDQGPALLMVDRQLASRE